MVFRGFKLCLKPRKTYKQIISGNLFIRKIYLNVCTLDN